MAPPITLTAYQAVGAVCAEQQAIGIHHIQHPFGTYQKPFLRQRNLQNKKSEAGSMNLPRIFLCAALLSASAYALSCAFSAQSADQLFRNDSASGADALASTTIDANVCINSSGTLNGDRANGASGLACATANARLSNLMCHSVSPLLRALQFRGRNSTAVNLPRRNIPYGQCIIKCPCVASSNPLLHGALTDFSALFCVVIRFKTRVRNRVPVHAGKIIIRVGCFGGPFPAGNILALAGFVRFGC